MFAPLAGWFESRIVPTTAVGGRLTAERPPLVVVELSELSVSTCLVFAELFF